MDEFPRGHHDFGSIDYLKGQLALFQESCDDDSFLRANQIQLERLLLHSLNRDATYHDAVKTLFAIASYIYRQDDQSVWHRIAWDALVGALNLGDGKLQAQIMTLLSRYHMLEGKHQLARKNVEQALQRAQEENNDSALLWAYIRFFQSQVYQPTDISRPEVIQRTLTLAEKVNEPRISTELHYALAHFYRRWCDWERAFGHGEVAFLLARQYRDDYNLVCAAYILVTICRATYSPATKHFFRIAQSLDTSQLHQQDYASILMHKSGIHYEMGHVAEAAEGYREAIKLLKNLERPFHVAICLQGLALAQIRLKQFNEAQTNLERAEELWGKYGSPYERADLRYNQGFLEAWRGNHKFSLVLLEEAFGMTDEIPDIASRQHLRDLISEAIRQVRNGGIEDTFRLT